MQTAALSTVTDIGNPSDEEKILIARIGDAVRAASDRYETRFIGFLDEHMTAVALSAAGGYRFIKLYGGYDHADRVTVAVYPEYCEPDDGQFPIVPLTLTMRTCACLSHRDFLGSLMSLGITRDSVGDILYENGRAVIFVSQGISDYVVSQLDRVGGEGVKIERGMSLPLPQSGRFEQIRCTVSSVRLDCIVGALCNKSRSAASELIESGLVSVNSVQCCNVSRKLTDTDRVSVRGYGKYIIDETGSLTRKGRIVLDARKYI